MAQSVSFERPFKYAFNDPNWKNRILMGGLYSLTCVVIVGIFVLAGYSKKLFLALAKDENAPIPEIDFGEDLKEGLPVVGIAFIYGLGMIVLSMIPILNLILAPLAGIAMAIVLPVAMMKYFTTGQFGAAFDFKWIIDFVKANINNLVILFVVGLLAGIIGQLGAIACGVGALFTMFWSLIARTVVMADVWRAAEGAPSTDANVSPAP